DRLQGEQVVRAPRTVHRLYTVTFGPSGAAERFELVTHNVSGAPGPAETKATATFQGDSAVSTLTRSDSTRTVRARVGAGALPYRGRSFGLVEEVARSARAAGRDRYTMSMLVLGDTEPMPVTVTRGGSDSLTMMLDGIGPLRVRLDGQGRLLGVSGIGARPRSPSSGCKASISRGWASPSRPARSAPCRRPTPCGPAWRG